MSTEKFNVAILLESLRETIVKDEVLLDQYCKSFEELAKYFFSFYLLSIDYYWFVILSISLYLHYYSLFTGCYLFLERYLFSYQVMFEKSLEFFANIGII